MTDRLDPSLTDLERRLERTSLEAPPPGLRRRVLSAVDAVCPEGVMAAPRGRQIERAPVFPVDLVIVASALTVAVVVAACAGLSVSNPTTLLTLDDRAHIAGVHDEALGTLATDARQADSALYPLRVRGAATNPGILRAVDARQLLETL